MALLAQDSAVPCALVALTVFRAPAWACLICFTSYKERTRICQIFAGKQGPELDKCQEAFSSAFADLADIEISEETCHSPPGSWGVCAGRAPSALRTTGLHTERGWGGQT